MPSMNEVCTTCGNELGLHAGFGTPRCPDGNGGFRATTFFTVSPPPAKAKFKVGDKVRCVNSDGSAYMLMIGSVYTVTSVRDPGYGTGVVLTLDANADTWRENRFELADAAPVGFRVDDIVRCRVGNGLSLLAGDEYRVIEVDDARSEVRVSGSGGIWGVDRFVLVRRHSTSSPKPAEPDFSAEMAFFTRCEAPNCCAKCAAPVPCKYHS